MATPKQTDPQYKLRLPQALKDKIEEGAALMNRSMNAEIVHRLEAYENASWPEGLAANYLVARKAAENRELYGSDFESMDNDEILDFIKGLAGEIENATWLLRVKQSEP